MLCSHISKYLFKILFLSSILLKSISSNNILNSFISEILSIFNLLFKATNTLLNSSKLLAYNAVNATLSPLPFAISKASFQSAPSSLIILCSPTLK